MCVGEWVDGGECTSVCVLVRRRLPNAFILFLNDGVSDSIERLLLVEKVLPRYAHDHIGGFAASGKIGKSGAMVDVETEVKSATAAVTALTDIVKSVEVRVVMC